MILTWACSGCQHHALLIGAFQNAFKCNKSYSWINTADFIAISVEQQHKPDALLTISIGRYIGTGLEANVANMGL